MKINYSEMLSALHKHVHASTIYQKGLKSCRRGRVGHNERFICYFGVDPDHMGNLGEVLKRMLCVIWWGDHASLAEICTLHPTTNNPPLSMGTTSTMWAFLWGCWETHWMFSSLAHLYSAASSLSAASNMVFADSLLGPSLAMTVEAEWRQNVFLFFIPLSCFFFCTPFHVTIAQNWIHIPAHHTCITFIGYLSLYS